MLLLIKVCDSIMGSGKTMSTIAYLNEHSDQKFVYITPYLDEADRIRKGCPDLHFVEPSKKIAQYHFKKTEHTAALIRQGRNIATTHQAFKRYTPEMLEDIKSQQYTLIIDENVDILEAYDFNVDDLQIVVDAGYVKEDNGIYSSTGKEYKGKVYRELLSMLKSRDLIMLDDEKRGALYYWVLPPDLLSAFEDVFVLTYLFYGQSLHHLMKIYNLPYEYIGIKRVADGGFRFGSYPGYTPDYVNNLKNMLHIIEDDKINSVGDGKTALSMNWYKTNSDGVRQLSSNLYNYMNNVWRGPAFKDKKMWGTYAGEFERMKGKGYTKGFITFNTKATNDHRDKKYLVYIVNLFMSVPEKKFYKSHGIDVDEDMYALSIMVQWIWRSAIRDGEEVFLYIPSRRMRDILKDWIEKVSKEGNVVYGEKL